ncbi:MAG TPA: CoA transferase [Myxococcota bacterium]|nr:CoA transferase [Myxococcota bacterium]
MDALREIWRLGGGDPAALERVTLTGRDPVLPSSFHVGEFAQATIAAAGLAAAELWKLRGGRAQRVSVDARAAAIEFRSERYLRVTGMDLPPMWDTIAGVYRAGDRRYVRLHTNFPHHRRALVDVLGASDSRDSVQEKLHGWKGEDFETAATAAGAVVAMMRSPDEWAAHPQGRALARLPLFELERIGDADSRPLGAGARPLSGVRVLDLTRVVAGPVCGRTLAAHGADVLRIASPKLPFFPWIVIDTGRGKRSAWADLETPDGRESLARLLRGADVFVQSYRPGTLAARGFGPADAARLRPGIVCVSLSAYSHAGPWSARRGFDSLVQTATGFNHAEGAAAGVQGPKELPAQALDHGSGQLMAAAAMLARARQTREGGSWHVRVSLAQTGRFLFGLGRVDGGLAAKDPGVDDVQDRLEDSDSGFGRLRGVRHAAELSETPAHFARPALPLGSGVPEWSEA